MNEFTFKLSHPITDEEWNLITDAELEHTDNIEFTTPSGKKVLFHKVVRCEECKYYGSIVPDDDYCSRGKKKDGDSKRE